MIETWAKGAVQKRRKDSIDSSQEAWSICPGGVIAFPREFPRGWCQPIVLDATSMITPEHAVITRWSADTVRGVDTRSSLARPPPPIAPPAGGPGCSRSKKERRVYWHYQFRSRCHGSGRAAEFWVRFVDLWHFVHMTVRPDLNTTAVNCPRINITFDGVTDEYCDVKNARKLFGVCSLQLHLHVLNQDHQTPARWVTRPEIELNTYCHVPTRTINIMPLIGSLADDIAFRLTWYLESRTLRVGGHRLGVDIDSQIFSELLEQCHHCGKDAISVRCDPQRSTGGRPLHSHSYFGQGITDVVLVPTNQLYPPFVILDYERRTRSHLPRFGSLEDLKM